MHKNHYEEDFDNPTDNENYEKPLPLHFCLHYTFTNDARGAVTT